MIGFELSDDQKQIQALARSFVKDEVMPIAAQHDREETYPHTVVEAAFEVGLLNVTVPEAVGGRGLAFVGEAIVGEDGGDGCRSI